MPLFRRNKKDVGKSARNAGESLASAGGASTSPQEVGIVSGVLSTSASAPADSAVDTPFADIVARRFGPPAADDTPSEPTRPQAEQGRGNASQSPAMPEAADAGPPTRQAPNGKPDAPDSELWLDEPHEDLFDAVDADARSGKSEALPPRYAGAAGTTTRGAARSATARTPSASADRRDHLRPVAPLGAKTSSSRTASQSALQHEEPVEPALEVNPMAHIGSATTITGNIVAEEDLEIHGTIEGSVRLANHQVTIGTDGHVKASIDAQSVLVLGKVTGDVVAGDLVEVKPGGVVGGDVKAPRVIMHDGAVIVGGLDMSSALPSSSTTTPAATSKTSESPALAGEKPSRPRLKKVEASDEPATENGSA